MNSSTFRSVARQRLYRQVEVFLTMNFMMILVSFGGLLSPPWLGGSLMMGILFVVVCPLRDRILLESRYAAGSNSVWKRPLEDFKFGPILWIAFCIPILIINLFVSFQAWIFVFGPIGSVVAIAATVAAAWYYWRPRFGQAYGSDEGDASGQPAMPIGPGPKEAEYEEPLPTL